MNFSWSTELPFAVRKFNTTFSEIFKILKWVFEHTVWNFIEILFLWENYKLKFVLKRLKAECVEEGDRAMHWSCSLRFSFDYQWNTTFFFKRGCEDMFVYSCSCFLQLTK